MGRVKIKYNRPDAAGAAISLPSFQNTTPASQYAAARFQEWNQNAPEREALLQARLQKAQSDAELAGASFRYNVWKDQELRDQTTHYYNAMPMLQNQLKEAGIYPGSQRYALEMAAFASTIPDAITHNDAIRKDLAGYARVDEDQARLNKAMAEQGLTKEEAQIQSLTQSLASQGQQARSFSTTAQGGVDVKASRPADNLEDQLFKGHKLTRTQFETFNPSTAKIGTLDDRGNLQTNAQGTGGDIQFQAIKEGKLSPISMSIPEFNRYKTAFGQNPIPEQSAAPQATATPTPAIAPPQVGEVRNGFSFKGGNPADQNSWEQVQ